MIYAPHGRFLVLVAAFLLFGSAVLAERIPTAFASRTRLAPQTFVTVRWGTRPGVSRYRLQLANDREFADIVFDRVVNGHEYQVNDLPPGKYFWRVAPLDPHLGTFSSAGVIDVIEKVKPGAAATTNLAQSSPSVAEPFPVMTRRGWYAALADVSRPIPAHLRSPETVEIVATTNEGRVIALDGLSGVGLWIRQLKMKTVAAPLAVAVRDRSGLENVLVLSGTAAMLLDGKTGREIWHGTLPGVVSAAVAGGDKVFAIDGSRQRLFLIDATNAKLISDIRLPSRAVGPPVITNILATQSALIALEDGRLQIFDETGKLVRSGDAAAAITTAPLFVRTPRGQFVLVGTGHALTALNAENLSPLGRVTLKNSPQGSLFAQDLDSDGTPEVILFTDSGRVVVVKSDEGKVVWEADAKRAEATSFADINGDDVLDLLLTGREGAAFALSGRDGAIIWKDETFNAVVTNHAPAGTQRSSLVVSSSSGVLFIATDPGRGLRALEFPPARTVRK